MLSAAAAGPLVAGARGHGGRLRGGWVRAAGLAPGFGLGLVLAAGRGRGVAGGWGGCLAVGLGGVRALGCGVAAGLGCGCAARAGFAGVRWNPSLPVAGRGAAEPLERRGLEACVDGVGRGFLGWCAG